MSNTLTYDEAKKIYEIMNAGFNFSDADYAFLYSHMIKNAVSYASIRAGWNLLTPDQKRNTDESRTMAHDAFIASLRPIARLEGDTGAKWLQQLSDDRKRIGDFACYISLFLSLDAR